MGWVSVRKITSKILLPRRSQLFKMLKDDLPDLAPKPRRHIMFKLLNDIETFCV